MDLMRNVTNIHRTFSIATKIQKKTPLFERYLIPSSGETN